MPFKAWGFLGFENSCKRLTPASACFSWPLSVLHFEYRIEGFGILFTVCLLQTGVFYVVREAITHNPDEEDMEAAPKTEEQQRREQQQHQRTGGQGEEGSTKQPFHAHIEEIKLHGNSYVLQTTCKTGSTIQQIDVPH